jgi:DnaJ-class molecular chaperone
MPDAFDVLGVRPEFNLERRDIDRAYLPLAAAVHPDLAAGSEEAIRRMAEINVAKAALDNAESRADVLLRRLGGPAAEHEKSLPHGFLMEVMDVREQVEAAVQDADPERRREQAQRWVQWSTIERQRAIKEVGGMFSTLPAVEPARSAALRDIRVRLNAWRYIERLIEQLNMA